MKRKIVIIHTRLK